MPEPTLPAVFGAAATQTATTVTISKTDLATVGLTASANNTAESILTAILFLARNRLTEAGFNGDVDQSLTITNGFNSIVTRTNSAGVSSEYRQFQWQFNAHKLDNATLSPNDV